jgi:ABC-type transporter Mla maintaining outer membrane lipid asymmetry ATPase subunit MlaF
MENVAVGVLRDQSNVVLREINWTVQRREYWVVVGLQGSGKSDFLMMTAGLMPPAAGRYQLFGDRMPIFEESRLAERLRLGLVFENAQLFNHLTVRENIALPLRYHGNLTQADAAPEVQRFLAALELERWSESTPGAIGRNWQKRVALARALILQPEILLVDNPLPALDLRHSAWWLAFLEQLSKGHDLLHGRPLTLVVTSADVRPWKGRPCRFAVIRDQRFTVVESWSQLEAQCSEFMQERVLEDVTR